MKTKKPKNRWLSVVHRLAAMAALLLLCTFWSATVYSELFADHATLARVKRAIAFGVLVLVPLMAALGLSGRALSGKAASLGLPGKKLKRMKVIAANGIGVLAPAAFALAWLAARGSFGTWFYAVQAVELLAGAVNVCLMVLNARDGLVLSGRLKYRSGVLGLANARRELDRAEADDRAVRHG
jgi:hypothetical protein